MVILTRRVFLEEYILFLKGCFALEKITSLAEGGLLFTSSVSLKVIAIFQEKTKSY